MGEGTANTLLEYVQDVGFVGEGSPEMVAQAYGKLVSDIQKTCFIRAENSMDSIHKILSRPQDASIPVYSNRPKSTIPEESFDILIFTSPLNAKAYFARKTYQEEKIIAIGPTTANTLKQLQLPCSVAEEPSESGIARRLREVLNIVK